MKIMKSLLRFHMAALIVIALLALPAVITGTTGCAGPESARTTVGKSLESVGVGVHSAMNSYGVLYRANRVSPQKRAEILMAYERYQEAATLARMALDYNTAAPATPQVLLLSEKLIQLINALND